MNLGDLWNSTVQGVRDIASDETRKVIGGSDAPTRSQTSAPAPDLASAVATPGASFPAAKELGISLPILLIGGGALVFLLARRR